MKIAFVSTLQPDTNYFRYLALALQDLRVDVRVYADRKPQNLEVGLKCVYLLWSPGDRLYPFHILRQAFRDRPDVVHLHHEVGMFGGPINASLFPLVPILLKLFGFKIVTTIHAVVKPAEIDLRFLETFVWPQKAILIFPVKLYFFLLNWVIAMFSDRVIVHADILKKTLIENYHCPGEKILVVPHGVPERVDHPVELSPSSVWLGGIASGRYLLYFGYLHRRKGLEGLLKAFSTTPAAKEGSVKLVIAGGALQKDYDDKLKQLVTELGLSSTVVITGFISQTELRYLLDHCLFVVLPATYSIAASGPLAQVIAHEKPVIVSRVGVYAEEITDGENGLQSLPGNVTDLAEKIQKLATDENLLIRLGEGMKKMHLKRGWNSIAERTLKIYEDIIR
ncbi:MAG: glycosyltransferase family 4 protein [Patescibacteria group bacterium]